MTWKLDFNAAIEANRLALIRVLAGLFALIDNGAIVPRQVKYQILRLLRPAEAAARRLVFVLVERVQMQVSLPPLGTCLASPCRATPQRRGKPARTPHFQLFDPLKRFESQTRKFTKNPPRIWNLNNPHQVFTPVAQKLEPAADDELSAASITRRLKALETALDDLPAQAKRLAKIQARRKRPISKPKRIAVMRPGFPPGYRQRYLHEIDTILKECHSLACHARERERPG